MWTPFLWHVHNRRIPRQNVGSRCQGTGEGLGNGCSLGWAALGQWNILELEGGGDHTLCECPKCH